MGGVTEPFSRDEVKDLKLLTKGVDNTDGTGRDRGLLPSKTFRFPGTQSVSLPSERHPIRPIYTVPGAFWFRGVYE